MSKIAKVGRILLFCLVTISLSGITACTVETDRGHDGHYDHDRHYDHDHFDHDHDHDHY